MKNTTFGNDKQNEAADWWKTSLPF